MRIGKEKENNTWRRHRVFFGGRTLKSHEAKCVLSSKGRGKREEGRMHAEVYSSSSFGHAHRARAENGVGDTLGAWAQRLGTWHRRRWSAPD
jgi:hypothetical protein